MTDRTAAVAFKTAMIAATHRLWDTAEPAVAIVRGAPSPDQLNADDIVGFGRVTTTQEPATIGTRRSREETLTLTVVISVYRLGGADMEQVCEERAYKLLGDLADYVRQTDTTLDGTVRNCFLAETESEGATDPDQVAKGRLIEISANFTAQHRIATL